MRVHVTVCLAGVCCVGLGCSNLAELALHNLHFETKQDLDSCLEPVRDHLVAKAAWHDVERANPDQVYSAAYAQGFQDGYRDFIEEGGTGQPPPVPPACYWDLRYQTPLGHAAVEDWYAGFSHGVAAARASGNRRWVIVPSAPQAPVLGQPVSHEKVQSLPELPAPRKVDPGEPDAGAGSKKQDL